METAVPDYILDCVRSLPPMPQSVQRLMTLARDTNADFRQISDVVESDQVLTARVLRAANSAIYGVPRRVQTVRQANMILGRDAIVGLAIGASVVGMQASAARQWPTKADAYWQHSIAVALTARWLSTELKVCDPEEAFVAGLLHDIGKLVMLSYFGDLYAQVLLAAEYGTEPLHVLERKTCDTDHSVVGQALCMHWNIPQALTRAVAEHHALTDPAPGSIADLVRDANDLVKMFEVGNGGNRYVELRGKEYLPHRRILPEQLRTFIENLTDEVAEAEQVFANPNSKKPAPMPTHRSKPVVHIQASIPAERELLTYILWFWKYEPVVLEEMTEVSNYDEIAACITDVPLGPAFEQTYRSHGIPVLDFAEWRKLKRQPIAGGQFDAFELRQWLKSKLVQHDMELSAA